MIIIEKNTNKERKDIHQQVVSDWKPQTSLGLSLFYQALFRNEAYQWGKWLPALVNLKKKN